MGTCDRYTPIDRPCDGEVGTMQNGPFTLVFFALFCVLVASGFQYLRRRLKLSRPIPILEDSSASQPNETEVQKTEQIGHQLRASDTRRFLRGIELVLAQTAVVFVAPWAVSMSFLIDDSSRHAALGCIGAFIALLTVGIVYSRNRMGI